MTYRNNRLSHACLLMTACTFASGWAAAAAPDAAAITRNPYFHQAIQASTQMMTVLTVAIPVSADVTASINQASLGFSIAGWTLVAQGEIERDGTTTQILLTYRKSKS